MNLLLIEKLVKHLTIIDTLIGSMTVLVEVMAGETKFTGWKINREDMNELTYSLDVLKPIIEKLRMEEEHLK